MFPEELSLLLLAAVGHLSELLSGFMGPEVSPLDTPLVQFGNQFPKWVIHL